jgi:hypothetical protein
MKVEYQNNDVVLTFPKNVMDISEIQNLIDYVKYREIISKSNASQSDADNLANEINESFWDKTHEIFK